MTVDSPEPDQRRKAPRIVFLSRKPSVDWKGVVGSIHLTATFAPYFKPVDAGIPERGMTT